jgi:hypothetical protein
MFVITQCSLTTESVITECSLTTESVITECSLTTEAVITEFHWATKIVLSCCKLTFYLNDEENNFPDFLSFSDNKRLVI